jgi:hypothetical protein
LIGTKNSLNANNTRTRTAATTTTTTMGISWHTHNISKSLLTEIEQVENGARQKNSIATITRRRKYINATGIPKRSPLSTYQLQQNSMTPKLLLTSSLS